MDINCLMPSSEEELDYSADSDLESEQPIRIIDVRSEYKESGLVDMNNNKISVKSDNLENLNDDDKEVCSIFSAKQINDSKTLERGAVTKDISCSSSSNASFDSNELDATASTIYSEEELYSKSQVQDVIFWILTRHVKSMGKFKKYDLHNVGGIKGKSREIQTKFLNEVTQTLAFIFGFDLKESTQTKGYLFLFNQFDYPIKMKKSESRKIEEQNMRSGSKLKIEKFECNSKLEQIRKCHNGLLFAVLTMIYMSPGESISDSNLDSFLMKMGLLKDIKSGKQVNKEISTLFGKNCKETLMKEWINAKYIEKSKTFSSGKEAGFEYKWGERADLEINKCDVLKHVAQTYEVKECAFKEQYEKIYPK